MGGKKKIHQWKRGSQNFIHCIWNMWNFNHCIKNENCQPEECSECSGIEALTAETHILNEEENGLHAIWKSGDLIKKSALAKKFLKDMKQCVRSRNSP